MIQSLIFVSFKSLLVPYVYPSRRYLIGRADPKEYMDCDRVRESYDFEEIIRGEFISQAG